MADRLPQATAGPEPGDDHRRDRGEATGLALPTTDGADERTTGGVEAAAEVADTAGLPYLQRLHRRVGWFGWWLVAISLAGLAIRLVYLVGWRSPSVPVGDSFYYHQGANLLADGEGYVHPHLFVDGVRTPGADHPPAFLTVLAGFSLVGFRSFFSHQVIGTLLGTLGVAAMGLTGRRIAGERVGLVAAGLTAVNPNLFFYDPGLWSETLVVSTTAFVLLAAYRWWDRPSVAAAAAFGLAVGVAALARSELLLLGPAIAVPLVWWRRRQARSGDGRPGNGRWLRQLVVAGGAAAVAIGPWVGYNLARFEEPTTLSVQVGATLGSANCHDVYYGDVVGYWQNECNVRVEHLLEEGDPSVRAAGFARIARQYIRDNASRVPYVVGARVGRTFALYEAEQQINLDSLIEGRERSLSESGLFLWYGVAAAGTVGLVRLRRGGRPIFPLVAAVASTAATVAVVYGSTRFRVPAELALMIPAAVTLDAGVQAARRRWRARRGPGRAAPAATTPPVGDVAVPITTTPAAAGDP